MVAKLTLTIDKDVVDKAKKYAKRKNRSVSKLVEEYLNTVSTSESLSAVPDSIVGDITDQITGMFRNDYQGQEYQNLLEDALIENNL
jgi:hypothetical protein